MSWNGTKLEKFIKYKRIYTSIVSHTICFLKQADFNLLQSLFLSGRDKEPEFHKYACNE